jgi:SAM-dependent methyltransferase
MPADTSLEPTYPLVRSEQEYARLRRQAAFLGGTTERLFRAAGLGPGMRVLDVGCGAGDVALLAAGLVGPQGEVVGVDIDRAALDVARARARSLRLSNISFVEGDARTVDVDGTFDAAVGRLVLMYAKDPAAVVRRIAERIRPGGIVAVQELDLDPAIASRSLPGGALWDRIGHLLLNTFVGAGMHMRMGRQLFTVFLDAGLPGPQMCDEALVGGGPDFGGYEWIADVVRGVSPLMAKLGIADVDRLELSTLADRLRDETVATRGVVWTPALVGAYARKPPVATTSA